MGLIQSNSDLINISGDINLRCDPIHVINLGISENLKPTEIDLNHYLVSQVESINNGINYSASYYSLEPTRNIYISVKEFDNGQPLIFDKEGNFRKSIVFLKDEVETDLPDDFERGKINLDEIIIARSGTVGKVAWFGEFLNQNSELNLIASGFTTKLKIKKDNDLRFVSIWLNLPFIKYYLIAKSSGKCQRNISQEYLYRIPLPKKDLSIQKKLANKYYPLINELEQNILNIPTKGSIVDLILSQILKLDFNFHKKDGLLCSEDSLNDISNRYSLRCDAKQRQNYFRDVFKLLNNIETIKLGDIFNSGFRKGNQPKYLEDQEEDGIPIISTLAIQDLKILKDACRKISFDDFNNIPEDLKPRTGDILMTLDGVVSVGKPTYFNIDEDYGIDSHIGIVRLNEHYDPELVAFLLGSELCQAQFKLFESGSTSHSINEIELRNILIPYMNKDQADVFKRTFKERLEENEKLVSDFMKKRNEIYLSFLGDLKGV